MRTHTLIGLATILGACGGRQVPTTGLGQSAGHVSVPSATAADKPRAICTPHLGGSAKTSIIKIACEVDGDLYRAILQPRRPRQRVRHGGMLMGFPDEYVEPDEIAARANDAAAKVDELLSQGDPIAGVGDPQAVRDYLEKLPISVLLPTLDILKQRQQLEIFVPDWEHNTIHYSGTRLGRALYLSQFTQSGDSPSKAVMTTAARAIDDLTMDEQHAAFRYLLAKRNLPSDVETMLEGFMALESSAVEWREPVALAEPAVGAAPETIEPGPWDKPANEPAELYIGREAHRVIGEYYRAHHLGEVVTLNHRPISAILERLADLGHDSKLGLISASEGVLRPDIFNLSSLVIYEIKPTSYMSLAQKRVSLYMGILAKGGITVSLGPPGAPGTTGQLPAPGGVFLFTSPSPGVITYDYRRGRLVPVEVPETNEQESPSWEMHLEPIPEEERQRVVVMVFMTMGAIFMAILTATASP